MGVVGQAPRAFQPYVGLSVGLHLGALALMLALAPGRSAPPLPAVISVALIAPPAAAAGFSGPPPVHAAPLPAEPQPPTLRAKPRPAPAAISLAAKPAPEPAPRAPEPTPAPPPHTAATASPGVSAAPGGAASGDAASAGSSGAGGSRAAAPGGAGDAVQAYIALVRARIQAERRYSPMARRRGLEGVVTVHLQLDAAGRVSGIDVEDGAPLLLSKATQQAVERAGPFPPPPDGLGVLRIPVRYRLTD